MNWGSCGGFDIVRAALSWTSPRLMTRENRISQKMRPWKKSPHVEPCQGQTCNIFWSGPCDHFCGLEHWQKYMLVKFLASGSFLALRNGQTILSTLADLHPSIHKPVKIKELGLLTNIFVKSASRRFSWCNSQLLIPKVSYENGWFMFLLGKAFSGTHRLK